MMNDDLVKRLREDQPVTQDMASTMQCDLQNECADRIEALEAQLAESDARAIRLAWMVRDLAVGSVLHDPERDAPDNRQWVSDRSYICEENAFQALRAQLAAAEADKLEAMQRVLEAAKQALLHDVETDKDDNRIWDAEGEGRPYICEENAYRKICALDLDALAEGGE